MGIYADIQADLKEAMDDDLADAVATLTIIETASSTTYDPSAGEVLNVPVIGIMRCLIVDADLESEIAPDSDSSKNDIEVLVLDSEKTIDFKTGVTANVRDKDYEVMRYKIDPVGATHNLELRGL